MKYIEWLNSKDLKYREGVLFFANLNTIEIAEKFCTPIYIVNEQLIRKRYRNLKEALNSEYENNRIHYAVKANSNLSILNLAKIVVNSLTFS